MHRLCLLVCSALVFKYYLSTFVCISVLLQSSVVFVFAMLPFLFQFDFYFSYVLWDTLSFTLVHSSDKSSLLVKAFNTLSPL